LFQYNVNVTSLGGVFSYCTSLTSIPSGLFQYNVNINNFNSVFRNTSITSIPNDLFHNCTGVTDFTSTFNTTPITSIPNDLFHNNIGVTNFNSTFRGCSSLTTIPNDLFHNCSGVTDFTSTFYSCVGLNTLIPNDLFQYNTEVTNFSYIFYNCQSLTTITNNLFQYNTKVTDFSYIFYNCTGLTSSIPNDLFQYNIEVTNFDNTFYNCKFTGSIPSNLFQYNTKVTNFSYTFSYCSSLTSIPSGLFDNCTGVTDFSYTFANSSGLSGSIPEGLFDSCTNVINFNNTFDNCTGLSGTIPEYLFYYCTKVSSFSSTFRDCINLTLVLPNTFINNLQVNSFVRTFSGCRNLKGYAPRRNSSTDYVKDAILLSNWKYFVGSQGGGNITPSFQFQVTTTGSSQTITIPHLSGYTYNYTITYGDATGTKTVTSYNDIDCTHIYTNPGTYDVVINGVCESFYINNDGNMKLSITKVIQWGDIGIKKISFYGCSNLISIPLDTFCLYLVNDFTNSFRDCSSLTYSTRLWISYPNSIGTDCFTNDTNLLNYSLIPINWGGEGGNENFELEITTTTINQSITIPQSYLFSYDYIIDWGDNNSNNVSYYNDPRATHIYSEISGYTIKISGIFERIEVNNTGTARLPITKILNWGDVNLKYVDFYGCNNLNSITSGTTVGLFQVTSYTFRNCFNLTSIPSNLFQYSTNVIAFNNTFHYSGLVSIPNDLFRYNTKVTSFVSTFQSCTSLVSGITADLFRYNTKITTLASVFNSCTKITEIPNDFISGLTSLTTLTDAFNGCVTLTKIGSNAFKNLPNLTAINTVFSSCPITIIGDSAFEKCSKLTTTFFTFANSLTTIGDNAFKDCSGVTTGFASKFGNFSNLASIGANIFSGCTAVTSFASTFQSCTSLTGITSNIFDTNINVTAFQSTFYGCTSLTTIPDGLFKYNTLSINFSNTFYNCPKLQVNPWTFYLSDEESTRFNGKTVNFSSCFQRTTFTGVQGTAPDLWNCTGLTSTKTNCFDGNGNSVTSLSNYNDIPIAWL
jgi:hypothetical protein